MSPAWTRRRKSWRRSWSSLSSLRSSPPWAPAFPRASSSSARPAPARRFSPRPSPARPACPSSPSAAPSSSRCSSASAPPACATCSTRRSATPPASSSSTRSTPSAATAARVSAAATPKGKPLDSGVNMEVLAKQPPGFSGADLANLVNEASILAARRGKKKVTMPEFDEAVDRVIAGPERKSRVISQREREIIAYHEAGHAMVGYLLPNADPPYKISIVSRGMAGGFTRFLPEEDRHLYTKTQFKDMLAATLG